MKKTKRFISLLLALSMVFTMASAMTTIASAAESDRTTLIKFDSAESIAKATSPGVDYISPSVEQLYGDSKLSLKWEYGSDSNVWKPTAFISTEGIDWSEYENGYFRMRCYTNNAGDYNQYNFGADTNQAGDRINIYTAEGAGSSFSYKWARYIATDEGWQEVIIPLSSFSGSADWSKVKGFSLYTHGWNLNNTPAEGHCMYIDEVWLEKNITETALTGDVIEVFNPSTANEIVNMNTDYNGKKRRNFAPATINSREGGNELYADYRLAKGDANATLVKDGLSVNPAEYPYFNAWLYMPEPSSEKYNILFNTADGGLGSAGYVAGNTLDFNGWKLVTLDLSKLSKTISKVYINANGWNTSNWSSQGKIGIEKMWFSKEAPETQTVVQAKVDRVLPDENYMVKEFNCLDDFAGLSSGAGYTEANHRGTYVDTDITKFDDLTAKLLFGGTSNNIWLLCKALNSNETVVPADVLNKYKYLNIMVYYKNNSGEDRNVNGVLQNSDRTKTLNWVNSNKITLKGTGWQIISGDISALHGYDLGHLAIFDYGYGLNYTLKDESINVSHVWLSKAQPTGDSITAAEISEEDGGIVYTMADEYRHNSAAISVYKNYELLDSSAYEVINDGSTMYVAVNDGFEENCKYSFRVDFDDTVIEAQEPYITEVNIDGDLVVTSDTVKVVGQEIYCYGSTDLRTLKSKLDFPMTYTVSYKDATGNDISIDTAKDTAAVEGMKLVFSNGTRTVEYVLADKDYYFGTPKAVSDGSKVTVEVEAASASDKAITPILAQFGIGNAFKAANPATQNIIDGKISVELDTADVTGLKLFLWDNLETIKPLRPYYDITVE